MLVIVEESHPSIQSVQIEIEVKENFSRNYIPTDFYEKGWGHTPIIVKGELWSVSRSRLETFNFADIDVNTLKDLKLRVEFKLSQEHDFPIVKFLK